MDLKGFRIGENTVTHFAYPFWIFHRATMGKVDERRIQLFTDIYVEKTAMKLLLLEF
jgi:hypothetical protein